jgi:hypothetical protein
LTKQKDIARLYRTICAGEDGKKRYGLWLTLPKRTISGFGGRRGKFVGLDNALEGGTLVGTIAKRFPLGKAAAAETDFGAAAETISAAFLIYDFHFTVNQQRAVVHNRDLDIRHSILRSELCDFF